MRLLFDANLSPEVARRLKVSGHDAIHGAGLGLLTAPDPEIMEAAAKADRILVTADSDFADARAGRCAITVGSPAALRRSHATAGAGGPLGGQPTHRR